MLFYLGTHQTAWLGRLTVPLFISRRRLYGRRSLPRATCRWALDSGGFSELSQFGAWTVAPRDYIAEARRYREEIGQLDWCAPMDWMCEPVILQQTGLTVREHQQRTTRSYLQLKSAAADLPWIPVLQGWERSDYCRHAEDYDRLGIDLARLPVVGLGSVCRRQHMGEAAEIVQSLKGLPLHGFGFKITGLSRIGALLASADSMAWSFDARRRPPLPGCPHINCANCEKWALRWREKVLHCLGEENG